MLLEFQHVLVNIQKAIWKWPLIVDVAIKNGSNSASISLAKVSGVLADFLSSTPMPGRCLEPTFGYVDIWLFNCWQIPLFYTFLHFTPRFWADSWANKLSQGRAGGRGAFFSCGGMTHQIPFWLVVWFGVGCWISKNGCFTTKSECIMAKKISEIVILWRGQKHLVHASNPHNWYPTKMCVPSERQDLTN